MSNSALEDKTDHTPVVTWIILTHIANRLLLNRRDVEYLVFNIEFRLYSLLWSCHWVKQKSYLGIGRLNVLNWIKFNHFFMRSVCGPLRILLKSSNIKTCELAQLLIILYPQGTSRKGRLASLGVGTVSKEIKLSRKKTSTHPGNAETYRSLNYPVRSPERPLEKIRGLKYLRLAHGPLSPNIFLDQANE